MPPETPAPCRVKLAAAVWDSPGFKVLLLLAEALGDQLAERRHRRVGVLALGLDENAAALARGEHHHAHDALRVHAAAVAREPDLRGEAGRDLGELRRGARVQAELVHDLSLGSSHR